MEEIETNSDTCMGEHTHTQTHAHTTLPTLMHFKTNDRHYNIKILKNLENGTILNSLFKAFIQN